MTSQPGSAVEHRLQLPARQVVVDGRAQPLHLVALGVPEAAADEQPVGAELQVERAVARSTTAAACVLYGVLSLEKRTSR